MLDTISFAILLLQEIECTGRGEHTSAANVEGVKAGGTASAFTADKVILDKKRSEQEKLGENMKEVRRGDPKYKDISLTNMRETIAKRLSFSKQSIPHYYLTSEIKMDELLKLVVFRIFFLLFCDLLNDLKGQGVHK